MQLTAITHRAALVGCCTTALLRAARHGNKKSPVRKTAAASLASRKQRKGRAGGFKSSLSDFHPAIAETWIAAASNKMLQPHHVSVGSCKLVWWLCPSCRHQFHRRIHLHLAAGGACPSCQAKPSLHRRSTATTATTAASPGQQPASKGGRKHSSAPAILDAVSSIKHCCRPNTARGKLSAENANMICRSVADAQYLRTQEQRNLLPMLAKNFEKERHKIGEAETIYLSPKLDGIRCIAAYRADTKEVLFFSRSGTLFECCDEKIEPALRHLFVADPSLVLDGELYNDSVNQSRLASLAKGSLPSPSMSSRAKQRSAAATTLPFLQTLVDAVPSVRAVSRGQTSSNAVEVVNFDQLTSAIRTTRQRRTADVVALQQKLQYHVFDVLYASAFPQKSGAFIAFRDRYDYLRQLLAGAIEENAKRIKNYDGGVLRIVPSFACFVSDVDAALRASLQAGYEGVMVRREEEGQAEKAKATVKGSKASSISSSSSMITSGKAKIRKAARATAAAGKMSSGYQYGQRSARLLKYKVMQDAEYTIVGAVEGAGKWTGCLGAFVCTTADQKHRFTVTPASTDAEKKKMWKTWRQYRGKALTVQYQELSSDGVPRFPVGKCIRGASDGRDWL